MEKFPKELKKNVKLSLQKFLKESVENCLIESMKEFQNKSKVYAMFYREISGETSKGTPEGNSGEFL